MTSKKTPVVKMSLRVGTCRIYFSDRDVRCPLCRAMVPAGTHHECLVNDSGAVLQSNE
jgi:hypothetical protein